MAYLHWQIGTSPNQQLNPYYHTCTKEWLSSILELKILHSLYSLFWNRPAVYAARSHVYHKMVQEALQPSTWRDGQ